MKNLLLGVFIILFIAVIVFLIVKCFTNQSNFNSNNSILEPIPKVIHKVIIEHSGNLPKFPLEPKELQEAHDSWKKMNPEYEIKYYSMNDCREYLKKHFEDSDFLQAFDCLNAYSGKCNFFRYCVLYNEGGWYSDWKQVCLKQNLLNNLCENNESIILFNDTSCSNLQLKGCIQTAFIGVIKNHPLFLQAIKNCIYNIQNKIYGKNVWYTTGPCLLGKSFKELTLSRNLLKGYYNHPKNMFILNNGKKIIIHKCKNCGLSQNWNNGNNYIDLYNKKKYYC